MCTSLLVITDVYYNYSALRFTDCENSTPYNIMLYVINIIHRVIRYIIAKAE